MAVKTKPRMDSFQALPPTLKTRVAKVTQFVSERGVRQTDIQDVARGLRIKYGLAWASLDAAWNCGLITKVKEGRGCYWIRKSRQGLLIDKNRLD